jgi:tripartite-type tricarboxylate transporter receptor subunit TctC
VTPLSERKEDRDVTVTKEAGLDYQMSVWVGIFAPKSTPKPIVDKLAVALDKSLDDPGVKAKVAELGGSIPPKSERMPAKFSRFVNAESCRNRDELRPSRQAFVALQIDSHSEARLPEFTASQH